VALNTGEELIVALAFFATGVYLSLAVIANARLKQDVRYWRNKYYEAVGK
jgi:hypothetical protein